MTMFYVLSYIITAVAAVCDIRKKELPWPVFAASGLVSAACMIRNAAGGGSWFTQPLLSLIPGAALIALAFLSRGAMGYGDGLYVMSVGPVFGIETMFFGVFAAFLLCAVTSAVLLILRKADRKSILPYIPFLLMGMGVAGYALS